MYNHSCASTLWLMTFDAGIIRLITTVEKGENMNFFRKAKRTGILSLICVVLFMYIGSDYMSASEVGTYTENVLNEKTDSLATAEGRTGIEAGAGV